MQANDELNPHSRLIGKPVSIEYLDIVFSNGALQLVSYTINVESHAYFLWFLRNIQSWD